MGTGASSLTVALLVLTVAASRLAAQEKPPAPPEPPPPAAAEKPSSDALAQEAEGKPNEPEKDKKSPSPWRSLSSGRTFVAGIRRRHHTRAWLTPHRSAEPFVPI